MKSLLCTCSPCLAVFTGGTDSGVMRYLGRMASAVSVESGSHKESCLVGVVPWGGVRGRQRFVEGFEEKRKERNEAKADFIKRCLRRRSAIEHGARAPRVDRRVTAASDVRRRASSGDLSAVDDVEASLVNHEIPVRFVAADATPSQAGTEEADLEPNHTHFLLVDDGSEGKKAWGSELELRFAIEKIYCERRRVPRVMLVVQGGVGTLTSVHYAVKAHCPVVVIADSGGVASLLAHFCKTYHDEQSDHYGYGEIPQGMKLYENHRELIKEIVKIDAETGRFLLRTFESGSNVEKTLLDPFLGDVSGQLRAGFIPMRDGQKLRLAVAWNQQAVAKDIVLARRYSDADRAIAIQSAVQGRNVLLVKLLGEQLGGSGGYSDSKSSGWGLPQGKGFDYVRLPCPHQAWRVTHLHSPRCSVQLPAHLQPQSCSCPHAVSLMVHPTVLVADCLLLFARASLP